jgi:tRNA-splicing ligase RtcB
VKVEQTAVEELSSLLDLQATLEQIQAMDADFFAIAPQLQQISITPDFHKGKGIPIGTTMKTKGFIAPQAIGKDVNCGMRLMLTDLSETSIRAVLPELMKKIRHLYFKEGVKSH